MQYCNKKVIRMPSYIKRSIEPNVYFWRIATGTDVDILVKKQVVLHPIEVKASATPRPSMATGISSLYKVWVVKLAKDISFIWGS